MNKITWKYIKPLDNSNAIKDFLKKNNIVLSSNLIEFLEKNNGGRPNLKLFYTASGKQYVFKSLFSYNKQDKDNIYMIYPNLFNNKRTLYPIGIDSAGNFICIDYDTNQYVLWEQESDLTEKIIIQEDYMIFVNHKY